MSRNKYPEQTVQLILDTAEKLFMEKGYDHTSIQDILDTAKLSKGAVYHHFDSKEEIFEKICRRLGAKNTAFLTAFTEDTSLNGHDSLARLFYAALESGSSNSVIQMRAYLLDNPKFLAMQILEIYDVIVPNFLLPLLKRGMADGSIVTEHPEEMAEAIMLLCNIWLNPLLLPSTEDQLKARCQVFMQLMDGIGIHLESEKWLSAIVDYYIMTQKNC